MKENGLNIFLFNKKAGVLSRHSEYNPYLLSFTYDSEYDGLPLSCRMPVDEKYYGEKITYAFFQNLLPEESILDALARKYHFSPESIFDALGALGKECAGAIVITEDESIPPNDLQYRECTDEILGFLRKRRGCLALLAGSRLSLAGAQDKLPVLVQDDHFYMPVNYAPSSHILKPDSRVFPELVFNESFCLSLAQNMHLSAVEHRVYEYEDACPLLCVKRYDREEGKRLHQEDFCQILGLSHQKKYQEYGGFKGIGDVFDNAPHNLDIRHELLDFLLFSYFIGNNDGHIKNLSVIYRENGETSLAPLYDLVSTEVYPELSQDMAIAFGMHYKKSEICRDDLMALSCDLDIPLEDIEKRIEEFIETLPHALDKTKENCQDRKVISQIEAVVKNSITLAKRQFFS